MTSNEIGTDIIFKKHGDIKCDFKGISPVLKNKDEMDQYFLSATLQEDKQYDPLEEEKCETCSGCGFH